MPQPASGPVNRLGWIAGGDVNAFFGLMLDNIADLVLAVSLLGGAFAFPTSFALTHMVPGTALGVLVGDLAFTWMAVRLGRRTGRTDVTAMPLGLDTPSTFGMVFFVLGPAFLDGQARGLDSNSAAVYAWHIGMCAIVVSGLFKLVCSLASHQIRQLLPRAGLLGSLAAIALVLISFLPLLEIFEHPVVGFVSLAIILTAFVGNVQLPWRIPGALGALLVGGTMFYAMRWLGIFEQAGPIEWPEVNLLPGGWLSALRFEWLQVLPDSMRYWPVVIPFALATVVGGIDCTESAAAVGDEFHTGRVIAVEALATLVAGCCGGVIQTTPYIGHPAYKAMGGRAGYTLATALFVGAAGTLGFFSIMYALIPKAAIFPILVFVGLEITAQSFYATPGKHFAAVALACVPAMGYLVMIFADNLLSQSGKSLDSLAPPLGQQLQTLRVLSNGFVVTSLLWASGLAAIIDRRLLVAAAFFAVAGGCSLFGVIHSPLAGSPLVAPWNLPELPRVAAGSAPIVLAAAYGSMALVLAAWGLWAGRQDDAAPQSLESNAGEQVH